MSRFSKVKAATSLLTLAATLGAALAITTAFGGDSNGEGEAHFPGITLGLAPEAREALQQSGSTFPDSNAGFSACYRVPDGARGFILDKAAVDQALFNDPNPTARRAGVGVLIDAGGNYTIGAVPIFNIDGLPTTVQLYYDD